MPLKIIPIIIFQTNKLIQRISWRRKQQHYVRQTLMLEYH